MNQMNTKLQVC